MKLHERNFRLPGCLVFPASKQMGHKPQNYPMFVLAQLISAQT